MKKLFALFYCEGDSCTDSPFFVYFCLKDSAMITVKPIVVPSNRRKDGTFLVYIRVYYRGQVRRIPTAIVCKPGDLTRSGKIKNPDIQGKADTVASRMRESISDYSAAELSGLDIDAVVRKMKTADSIQLFRLDFFKFADTVIREKSPGARGQYVTACNAFRDYLGRTDLDINEITRPLLVGFLSWLRTDRATKAHKTPKFGVSPTGRARIPNGAESRHMAKLSHIYAKAKERYNDEDSGEIVIPRSPFRGLLLKPPPSHGQECLGVDMMQRVIDARHDLRTVQTALDCFVLSFALMGANLADLYELATVKKLRDGCIWAYQRRKTRRRRADGAWMQVRVPEEISGKLWPTLARLKRMAGKPEFATAKVNKGLARWCEDNGIPVFTFGAARHTWATLARKFGVEKATVDEGLCHVGDFPITDIYAERDWDIINAGNAKVLSMFRWE